MAKTETEAKILERLEAEAEQHAIDVVDVEVTGAGKQTVVTVRLDHADETAETITLDEVAAQTAWVSAAIDELDPFPNSYLLEVSSPGLGRPLKKEKDYVRNEGREIDLRFYKSFEHEKELRGVLTSWTKDSVTIQTEDGRELEFQKKELALVREAFDW